MSGGHINDERDRCLCQTYFESFDKEDLEDAEFIPGFSTQTDLSSIQGSKNYALRDFPDESLYLFSLHHNAEIGFLTTRTEFYRC
jgi:dynein heavy chain